MKFNKTISLLLLSSPALLINAEKVTFKVLAVNGTPVLNIGGAQQQMTPAEYPLYQAEVDVSNFPVTYKYSIDGVEEQFERQRNKDDKPLNEFFGRQLTVVEHPLLPRAYEAFKTAKSSKLFDDNYIGNFIITTDKYQDLVQNVDNLEFTVPAQVVYASPYAVKTFKNAEIGISGQSTRFVPKFSFKLKGLKDENNKELYGRSTVKLRAEHMDPSFLRDKLYGDILNSLGVPAVQNKFVRVFINGSEIGLYDVSDSISSDRYLRATFNGGEKFTTNNPLFKADFCPSCEIGVSYGDLGYYGDDPNAVMYAIYQYKGEDKDTVDEKAMIAQELIPLFKEINAYGNGGQSLSLDIDTFLKYMAMEFLAGGIDNYWNKPGNFYMFKNAAENKWYFHDSDFHYTFGAGGEPQLMMNTKLADYPPLLEQNVDRQRPPLDAIRKHPENEAKFQEIFKRLISTSFNPSAIWPRLDSLANLIREDAYWDFTLEKTNPNPQADIELKYTNQHFEDNIGEGQDGGFGNVPIKTFINTRLNNIATELGIQIPTQFESDLGFVENPSSEKEGDDGTSSSAMGTYSWSLYSAIVILLITIML